MADSDNVSEEQADVYHRSIFDKAEQSPVQELVTIVAELKGVEQDELDPLYSWVDGLIDSLYSSPPPAEAQGMVEFTYEGYRITLYQDGRAIFMGRGSAE
ncbi:hypothetical protein SAMN05216388_100969 [Halorientalis persicus]|uniref:Halobacterial output domain-containing protein n=1 Tax=Halorientalis persicus TaxID=1367881 RepID=A0A1H8MP37_9EURY|nr:HalOD1 output domain-containing protein [Halorientalis persicus]SEO19079.1 hypothetical protein SAMN05216388_100969 [Halorientalis persicus]